MHEFHTEKAHGKSMRKKRTKKKHLSYWIFYYLQTEMTRYDEEDEENECPKLSSHLLCSGQFIYNM